MKTERLPIYNADGLPILCLALVFVALPATALGFGCPQDSVRVGSWCVDKYEASTWETTNRRIIRKIKYGIIRSEDQLVGKAIRRGDGVDDYDDAHCPDNGNGCTKLFAVSIKDVKPSVVVTYVQAAALGTPDAGINGDGINTCNTGETGGAVPTGTTGDCVSDTGAYDMVGNVAEMVADWAPNTDGCVAPLFDSGDFNCYAAANRPSVGGAGILFRGGDWNNKTAAGVFSVVVRRNLEASEIDFGFRCGRIARISEGSDD